jgi:hypothetical protein
MPKPSVLRVALFPVAAMMMLTHAAAAQQLSPGDQEQCRPAVFCANSIGPDAPEVCFNDKNNMVCSRPGAEEEQRELREMLKRKAEELRRRLQQQTDQLRERRDW